MRATFHSLFFNENPQCYSYPAHAGNSRAKMAAALTYSDWFKQVPYGLAILEYDEQIHSNKKNIKKIIFFIFLLFKKYLVIKMQ